MPERVYVYLEIHPPGLFASRYSASGWTGGVRPDTRGVTSGPIRMAPKNCGDTVFCARFNQKMRGCSSRSPRSISQEIRAQSNEQREVYFKLVREFAGAFCRPRELRRKAKSLVAAIVPAPWNKMVPGQQDPGLVKTVSGCSNSSVTFLWCWRGIVSPFNTRFSLSIQHRSRALRRLLFLCLPREEFRNRCGRAQSLPRLGRGHGCSRDRRCAARRGSRTCRAMRASCSSPPQCSRGRS